MAYSEIDLANSTYVVLNQVGFRSNSENVNKICSQETSLFSLNVLNKT